MQAFLTSSLAVKIQRQARQAAETAYRIKVLFDTNQSLSNEKDMTGMITVTCNQLTKLLDHDILFYRIQDDGLARLGFSVNSGENVSDYADDK